jgi:hypothetical protein
VTFLHLKTNEQYPKNLSQSNFAVREEDGYYIVGSQNSPLWLRLRIRPDYPKTYCYKVNDSRIICGYGPIDPSEYDEFLQISITLNGVVTVRRDVYATLPLWLGESRGVTSLSNQHHVVHSDLPGVHLDQTRVMDALQPNSVQASTIWREMQTLNERHILEISGQRTIIHHPPSREWRLSGEAPSSDFRDFSRQFSAHLDRFIDTRLNGQRFAFEVSGGLDSSLLPLYYTRTGNDNGMGMASLIFPGDFEKTQRPKLDTIARLTNLPRYEVSLDDSENYPLTDLLTSGTPRPSY